MDQQAESSGSSSQSHRGKWWNAHTVGHAISACLLLVSLPMSAYYLWSYFSAKSGPQIDGFLVNTAFTVPVQLEELIAKLQRAADGSDELKQDELAAIRDKIETFGSIEYQAIMQISNVGDMPATNVIVKMPEGNDAIVHVQDENGRTIHVENEPVTKLDIEQLRNGESLTVYAYFVNEGPPLTAAQISYQGGNMIVTSGDSSFEYLVYWSDLFKVSLLLLIGALGGAGLVWMAVRTAAKRAIT